jgi:hypothetical protein
MPTVLRSGPYRFFFFSGDRDEPPHIHVERDRAEAKFWLEPVRLARSFGFTASELIAVERIVSDRRQILVDAWNDFFNA